MKPPHRRIVLGAILLVGLLALGKQISTVWPHSNQLRIGLPVGTLKSLTIEVIDSDGETIRRTERFPGADARGFLEHELSVPSGNYTIGLGYLYRPARHTDKSHAGDWTRVGVQHQIRLEGGDFRFPPPPEAQ